MHMGGVVMRKLWVLLFVLTAIGGSEAAGGKLENGTANSTHHEQGNAGSSLLAVAEIPSAGIGEVRNKTTSYTTEVDINNKRKKPNWMSRGRGGGEEGEAAAEVVMGVAVEAEEAMHGWGGGGGGGRKRVGAGGSGGGWGWGGGGGGAGWWKWGCGGGKGKGRGGRGRRNSNHVYGGPKRRFDEEGYVLGEFAQCMRKGRCKGMRLDCPLHCGGPCFYDCQHICEAHCRRRT
ncbi:unnamed protein product [Malus baccata var. baccata]